jgi:hypothetical protein
VGAAKNPTLGRSGLALRHVQRFASFNADNDPHDEHDFGSFEVAGGKFFWKIDYYDPRHDIRV